MTDQDRIIGRLEAQADSAEERLERIELKVDSLTAHIQQQKGGIRIIWAVATAGGVIGVSALKLGGLLLSAVRGTP